MGNYWTERTLHKGTTRRRFVGETMAVSAGLVGALVVGCGDDEPADGGTSPTAAPADQVDLTASLRAAVSADLASMDPMAATTGNQLSDTHIFNAPVHIDPAGETKGLTTDWKWINNNQTIELTVKPGIKFQNGEPFNADQLKFSFDRMMEIGTAPTFKSARKSFFAGVDKTTVMNETTVNVDLKAPDVALPNTLRLLSVMPKGAITQMGDEAFGRAVVGTGPFKFVSRTADTDIKLTRHDEYWNLRDAKLAPRLPYIANLTQLIRPEQQARLAALEAHEVDFAADISPDLAKSIDGQRGMKVFYAPEGAPIYIGFNTVMDKDPATGGPNPWRDIRVRKAANMAVDVDTIIKTLLTGKEKRAFGLTQATIGFPKDLLQRQYKFDRTAAKALLAEAGFPNGFTTDLNAGTGRFPQVEEVVQAVAGYLGEVGIKCNVKVTPFATFFDGLIKKSLPGLFHMGGDLQSEPSVGLNASFKSTGVLTNTVDPALGIDALIAAQAAEFDSDKRKKIIGDIAAKWYDNAMAIFLYETVRAHATSSNVEWSFYGSSVPYPEYWNMKILKT